MRRIHRLRVTEGSQAFAVLAAELTRRGERLGWLDWRPHSPAWAAASAGPLRDAVVLGVLRAVRVGEDGAVAMKPRTGPAVLADVIREYFRGCLAVLVHVEEGVPGDPETSTLPTLQTATSPPGYEVAFGTGRMNLSAVELCDRLRRPRPFAIDAATSGRDGS
ncbi:MAG: hypothetical protein AAGM22_13350 [Acidobacteriota bacterium]